MVVGRGGNATSALLGGLENLKIQRLGYAIFSILYEIFRPKKSISITCKMTGIFSVYR